LILHGAPTLPNKPLLIHTRLATLLDAPIVAPLFDAYRQFYLQSPDLALATRFITERLQSQQSYIIVALDQDDTAVGFCQLYPSFCSVIAQPIVVLYDLYVQPHTRRSGAGRKLLQTADALGRSLGAQRMDLTTAKTNVGAQSLYASEGWILDKVFLTYNKTLA
jgi:ribosomal protein S18 acetylase RimI-like enzyme